VRRGLAEQLRVDPAPRSTSAVRDYLRTQFMAREYASFTVLSLDNQNRLIKAEELSPCTSAQTSVYPCEVAKAALRHNADH